MTLQESKDRTDHYLKSWYDSFGKNKIGSESPSYGYVLATVGSLFEYVKLLEEKIMQLEIKEKEKINLHEK